MESANQQQCVAVELQLRLVNQGIHRGHNMLLGRLGHVEAVGQRFVREFQREACTRDVRRAAAQPANHVREADAVDATTLALPLDNFALAGVVTERLGTAQGANTGLFVGQHLI